MSCPNVDKNKVDCTCKSTSCPRHGTCCACVRYHRDKGGLPNCLK